MKLKLTLLFLTAFCATSFAQNRAGDQELSIGYGVLTSEQLLDGTQLGFILAPTTYNYKNDFSSGIFSLQYKYFLTGRFAFGLFAGIEWQTGNFYYNDLEEQDNIITTQLGTFSRAAFTIAPNFTFYYANKKNVRFYTSCGAGVMLKKETDLYEPALYNNSYNSYGLLNYPHTLPNSETSIANNVAKITGYYSPVGLSVNLGSNVCANMEVGIGYKGIFNGGISYHFKTGKVPKTFTGDVLILPYDKRIPKKWNRLGYIKSKRANDYDSTTTDKEIADVVNQAKMLNGNVFHLKKIILEDHSNIRQIRGTVYRADGIDELHAGPDAQRNEKYANDTCACIIVYVPAHPRHIAFVKAGDNAEKRVKPGTQYVYKLNKEGKVHISTRTNGEVVIDAKFGHAYYLKCSFDHRHTQLNRVSELIGELETSLIKKEYSIPE